MSERMASNTTSKRPSECTSAELDSFAALVRLGGQVYTDGLRERIAAADRLAFHDQNGKLVGVAGLKNLPHSYRAGIFRQAQSARSAGDFPLELGWVVVAPDHRGRGISGRLVQALLEAALERNVYAISHTDNTPIHRALERHHFAREGVPYPSAIQPRQTVQLFIWLGQSRGQ